MADEYILYFQLSVSSVHHQTKKDMSSHLHILNDEIDWTTMVFCFSKQDFLSCALQELLARLSSPSPYSPNVPDYRSTNCLICPSDDEWTNEHMLFQQAVQLFSHNDKCIHVPQMRLDGESVVFQQWQWEATLTFEKEHSIGAFAGQKFEAWTYVLRCSYYGQ